MKNRARVWAVAVVLAALPSIAPAVAEAPKPVSPEPAIAVPEAVPAPEAPEAAPSPEQLRLLFAQLLAVPEENPARQCLDQALRLNYGLMALRFAKADSARVGETLLRGAEAAELQQRQQELQAWNSTRSPGVVAHGRFGWCLSQQRLQSPMGEVEARCFQVAGVPAIALLRKAGGSAAADALAQLQGLYGKVLPARYLADTTDAIYKTSSDEEVFGVQRLLFASCLRQVR